MMCATRATGSGSARCDRGPPVAALDGAHRDEQDAARLAGLEDRDDVRMVDRRRGPGFPDEAPPEALVTGELGGQDLQRDAPATGATGVDARPRGPGSPDEAPPEALVTGELGGQDLQRDAPVQPRVVSAVDDRHSAPADLLVEAVTRDSRANGEFIGDPRGLVAHRASSARPPRSGAAGAPRDSIRRTVLLGKPSQPGESAQAHRGDPHARGTTVSFRARRPEA